LSSSQKYANFPHDESDKLFEYFLCELFAALSQYFLSPRSLTHRKNRQKFKEDNTHLSIKVL